MIYNDEVTRLQDVVDGITPESQLCYRGRICDINADGEIDAIDVALLQQAVDTADIDVCNDEVDNDQDP